MDRYLLERGKQLERIEKEKANLERVLSTIGTRIATGTDAKWETMYRRQFLDQLDNYRQEEEWVKPTLSFRKSAY